MNFEIQLAQDGYDHNWGSKNRDSDNDWTSLISIFNSLNKNSALQNYLFQILENWLQKLFCFDLTPKKRQQHPIYFGNHKKKIRCILFHIHCVLIYYMTHLWTSYQTQFFSSYKSNSFVASPDSTPTEFTK